MYNDRNGTKTITCNSSGSDYDHATYTLAFTVETIQYDKYASAWELPQNTTIAIGGSKPQAVNFAQAIMSKSNALSVTNYTDGVTTEAYTFEHDATEQTPALTDYRYIGASPNNYVEFNCDDNGENCETWRAIGVFYVDDGNNNWEWRVKLVRGSSLPEEDYWNTNHSNDWTTATLKNTLNGTYLNSLSTSAKSMIKDSKYYLGSISNDISTEVIYVAERGNTVCANCDNDSEKLSWIGTIGLIYPSDYYMIYSKGVDDICFNNPSSCQEYIYQPWNNERIFKKNGWLFNSSILSELDGKIENLWVISSYEERSEQVFFIVNSGSLTSYFGVYSNPLSVRPTLYLSSSVKTTSGDGSIDSPYKLSL